jgi:hypothetical protein
MCHQGNYNKEIILNMLKKSFALWIVVLVVQSCGKEEAGNFILSEPPIDKLAIIGFLGNNEVPILDISAISSISEDGFDPNITNASPVLWEDGFPIDTFKYVRCVACGRRLAGVYLGDTLRLLNGANYKLVVSAPSYENATVKFSEFRQIFSPNAEMYYDTVHTPAGLGGTINIGYEIVNDINFGYIDFIQKNTKFGLTSDVSRFFSPQTFNVWSFFENNFFSRPNPFWAGSTDSLSRLLITSLSPQEFEQRLLDSSINHQLYAVHMTNEHAEAVAEYLNSTAREEPGGPFVDQQLLVDNVDNGYGYVVMVDMVGGRAVLR